MSAIVLMLFVSFLLAGMGVMLFVWLHTGRATQRSDALMPLDDGAEASAQDDLRRVSGSGDSDLEKA